MPVIDEKCESISELVGRVAAIRQSHSSISQLWFRGLHCSQYELLPSLMRDSKTSEQVLERETRLLVRFRQRSLPYWPAGYPQNQWEHLFAMQHHGLPTRLLDWTESLMVSAYFSLRVDSHTADHSCQPIIWAFDPQRWNELVLDSLGGSEAGILNTADDESEAYEPGTTRRMWKPPVAIYGTHNSARIVAQRGTFVVWGTGLDSMETIAQTESGPYLWKLLLDGDPVEWRKDLLFLGIQETTVYPDMGSLATEIGRMEGW